MAPVAKLDSRALVSRRAPVYGGAMSQAVELFRTAATARASMLSPEHDGAVRLFNGYTEGFPGLAVELYGKTLVIHDATGPKGDRALVDALTAAALETWPFLTAVLWKQREAASPEARNGVLVRGGEKDLCRRVKEDGTWYATRLTLNRDTSLYLDTRPLRAWAKANLAGKVVLNAFAYTGSLGVAARAAPAAQVVHTDLNRPFLNVAKDSYAMNGWPVSRADFITGDIFDVAGRLKREARLFDCVFVDPPFFSVTAQGRVDLEADTLRLLNKVRPLVAHNGWLVAINNGVFVSGADYLKSLEAVCADGYAKVETIIPVPMDFVGTEATRKGALPVDPAPFNHSTKMAVLRVTRKDGRGATSGA
jgi:23S rRNA (cytosine1962-C5)-methyltransferase